MGFIAEEKQLIAQCKKAIVEHAKNSENVLYERAALVAENWVQLAEPTTVELPGAVGVRREAEQYIFDCPSYGGMLKAYVYVEGRGENPVIAVLLRPGR